MNATSDAAREALCRARCEAAGVTLLRSGGGFVVSRWNLTKDLAGLAELEAWVDRWIV